MLAWQYTQYLEFHIFKKLFQYLNKNKSYFDEREKCVPKLQSWRIRVYVCTSNILKELTTQHFATDALQKLQEW